jgi:hypothetical protein
LLSCGQGSKKLSENRVEVDIPATLCHAYVKRGQGREVFGMARPFVATLAFILVFLSAAAAQEDKKEDKVDTAAPAAAAPVCQVRHRTVGKAVCPSKKQKMKVCTQGGKVVERTVLGCTGG